MNVLIVDDSLVIRNIIEKTISSMGYGSLHAGNGQEALDVLKAKGKDIGLILLDWNMPILNGFETIKQIKKNTAWNHICVLMISTESEDESIEKVLAAGAHGYLTKPFDSDELSEKIRSTLAAFRSS